MIRRAIVGPMDGSSDSSRSSASLTLTCKSGDEIRFGSVVVSCVFGRREIQITLVIAITTSKRWIPPR